MNSSVKKNPIRSLEERFWAKVDRRGDDECWPWIGATVYCGYGEISKNGLKVRAPRLSWELFNQRDFPADLCACHTCDNPNCVNPRHIWPGTRSENATDMVQKGRQYQPRISHNTFKTHCINGHPLSGENLITKKNGKRNCLICQRAHDQNWRDRKRNEAQSRIICEQTNAE